MSTEAAAGGVVGEDAGSGISSCSSSPKSRMKFMCSYGGKIMPRPADGHLKYVGGETRVIGVPRDITFSELMKKLASEFECDMILKYQVIPEEFDVLVSVRSDEDLKHMLDECDRHENDGGTTKLRAFLFPSARLMSDNQNGHMNHPHAMEQRYIDAINNTIRSSYRLLPPITATRPSSLSSCSSPKDNSPDDNVPHDAKTFMSSYHGSGFPMHKVHSSPSLYNLGNPHHQGSGGGSSSGGNSHHYYPPHHHPHQYHHPHAYQSSSRPPHEHHRLSPSLPVGWPDFGRTTFAPMNQYHSNVHGGGSPNLPYNWSSSGHNFGSGNSIRHEHAAFGCRPTERLESLPSSPKKWLLE